MPVWSAEIKELEAVKVSIKGRFPELEKELDQLIRFDDANVILLYSRRCLEIIVTDLYESELNRPRGTQPLKGIIDKLSHEKKVPSNIIASMEGLNSLSTYGTHPKDFDPEQVKPALSNLAIIIKWYLKNKDPRITSKAAPEEIKHESAGTGDSTISIRKPKKKLVLLLSGLFLACAIIITVLFVFNIIGGRRQIEASEKSIAVLPFVNLSNDPEQEYFSNGMVDAILDHLFKVGELKVISRTSSMKYKDTELTLKEIARELGVSAVLEGSVQKIGNNVRIMTQLIDAKSDAHLWSETYDRNLADVFSIQSEVAQNVARELKATLTFRETELIHKAPFTTNQLAYDFYLKGNDYWSKYDPFLALDMYSKAIQEDSLFAAAYAQRALMHLFHYWNMSESWEDHVIEGRKDLKKAELLNPDLTEVKFVKAVAYYWVDRDYDRSIKILNDLKTESPGMADLYFFVSANLRRQGKMEESVSELKKAIQLDPFNGKYYSTLLETYDLLHQYDNVIECARQGLSLIPDYQDFKNYLFWGHFNKTGDVSIALAESGLEEEEIQFQILLYNRQYDKLIEYIDKKSPVAFNQYHYQPKTYRLAIIHYYNGNTSQFKIYADSAIIHLKSKLQEKPDDDRIYATLGKCYAIIGNKKEAIAFGKKAVDLKPIKLDAYQGAIKEQDLMTIYILTGNYDLALDKIEFLLSTPSRISKGYLKANPIFDNLRTLPRFQKIINSAQ